MLPTIDSKNLFQKLQLLQADIVKQIQAEQLPNGEFKTQLFFPKKSDNGWIDVGSSVFITSSIGILLCDIQNKEAQKLAKNAAHFVKQQMEPLGLWRFYPHHGLFKFNTPLDVDDTALASLLLQKCNIEFPNNKTFLLQQQDSKGNFLIWYLPRLRYLLQPKFFWFLINDLNLSYPIFFPLKGRTTEPLARFNDYEHAVTANVLLYLGKNEATQKSIYHLAEDLLFGSEIKTHFYPHLLFIYFHVSRLYVLGITEFSNLKQKICNYIEQENEVIHASVLNQSVAAITLMNFKISSDKVKDLILKIADTPLEKIAAPYPYFCTKDRNMEGGSVAFTYAIVCAALQKFQDLYEEKDKA